MKKKEPEQKTNVSDLNAYRRKRKRRSGAIRLAILSVVGVAAAIIILNFDAIVEPLRGIASKIDFKTSNEVGFPIQLPGSATYSFEALGENFLLLTDTYLYAFATDGGQIYALRHGYTNPVQKVNSKRVLLYDKNHYSFSLYNKTSQLYEVSTEDKIVYGSIGSGDLSAIVTDSPKYTNVVYIYDGSGNWKYIRKFADENVMQVQIADDQRYIYVSTLGVENGDLYTAVYKFDIQSEGNEIWKAKIQKNSISCNISLLDDRVMLALDNSFVSLNIDDGTIAGTYDFPGTLSYTASSSEASGLVFTDESSNANILVLLDKECTVLSTKTVSPSVGKFIISRTDCYILEKNELNCYNKDMEKTKILNVNDDYTNFLMIGNEFFLLGYDEVIMERF